MDFDQEADNSQVGQLSLSKSQEVPKMVQGQATNKYIEELKKLSKSETDFDKIYNIIKRITILNDFDAMQFAIKENFINVENDGETIFDRSIKNHNYRMAFHIMEFDRNIDIDRKSVV